MSDGLPEIYDHEVLALEGVVKALAAKQAAVVNLEAFRREAVERFAEVGFEVEVKTWETDISGVFSFDFEIVGRVEPVNWDPDRQVREVTSDILGLGTKGVIKSSGLHVVEGNNGRRGHRR